MGKAVLLLRLEGVWQSWGERSRWDVRDTATEPTKSGVVGLLGCALGYGMRDSRLETELDAGLIFGVRVESCGRVVRDYQTISGFLQSADGNYKSKIGITSIGNLRKRGCDPISDGYTIVSPRYYLEDASFLVALEERDGNNGLLTRCEAALKRPKWPVFLGRKACVPTRPVFEILTEEYDGIEEALRKYPWSRSGLGYGLKVLEEPNSLMVLMESEDGDYIRQDAVRSNQSRIYGIRRVKKFMVDFPGGGEDNVSIQT